MKVLFVSPESPLLEQTGGIATYIAQAMDALLQAGHEVALLSWAWERELDSLDERWKYRLGSNLYWIPIRTENIEKYPGFSYDQCVAETLLLLLKEAITRFRPDLIESTDYTAPLHAALEQSRAGLWQAPCPIRVFHHGLSMDVWHADANWPSDIRTLEDFNREYCQLHWADTVVYPSDRAGRRLHDLGIAEQVRRKVPEPYRFPQIGHHPSSGALRHFASVGTFKFGKGADAFLFFLNQLMGTAYEPQQVSIIGGTSPSTFKDENFWERYLRVMPPELLDRTRYTGSYERKDLSSLLGGVSYAVNLSTEETFGYTTVEVIAHGVIPIVVAGSAMAEFFPNELQEGILSSPYPTQEEILRVLAFWEDARDAKRERLKFHVWDITRPDRYVRSLEEYITSDIPVRSRSSVRPSSRSLTEEESIAVLIPHHNDLDRLDEALVSVYNQTRKPDQVLLLDDGSTDPRSVAHFAALRERYPDLQCLHQGNLGLCSARNTLLSHCTTHWAVFLDSDDLLAPEFLAACLSAVEHANADAVIPRRKNFSASDELYGNTNIHTPFHWVYNHYRMTALIKTACLRDIGFRPAIRNGEADDWLFWLQFSLRGYQAITLPQPLFHYRFRKGSMSWPWSKGQALRTQESIVELLAEAISETSHNQQTPRLAQLGLYYRSRTEAVAQFDLYHPRPQHDENHG